MKNIVTQQQIDELLTNAKVEVQTILGKCTTVTVQLENGFILTESSACVDPANYCEQVGKEICLSRIKNKLWELEGYCLQKELHEVQTQGMTIDELVQEKAQFGFDLAINLLKDGYKVARAGWNGKGMFLYLVKGTELQSGMKYGYGECEGEPTIVDTIAMKTAQNTIVFGWLASQTDMLAEDWMVLGGGENDAKTV